MCKGRWNFHKVVENSGIDKSNSKCHWGWFWTTAPSTLRQRMVGQHLKETPEPVQSYGTVKMKSLRLMELFLKEWKWSFQSHCTKRCWWKYAECHMGIQKSKEHAWDVVYWLVMVKLLSLASLFSMLSLQ